MLQPLQALSQAGTVERFGQVRIGFVFQRTEHHCLTGLGGQIDWLAREVLKEAGDAVVLEPEEARTAVLEAAEALAGAVKG